MATPYFNPDDYDEWSHRDLVAALIDAKTLIMSLTDDVQRERERACTHQQWYGSGQPEPYREADGQW